MGPVSMLILTLAAVAFSVFAILISRVFLKGSVNKQKLEPWIQFNVGYYLFALIFLIFDVELVFLYPWAVVVKKVGWIALVEIIIFFFILFMGLLYAHKKGALEWK
jgi:NADH:ubiquinone oxidoreductase subunit 3 (subunit A)